MLSFTTRIDWELTLVAVAIAPVLILLSQRYRPRLRRQSREAKNLEQSALAVVQEALGALRVVKAFGQEEQEEDRYIRRSVEGMRCRLRVALDQGRYALFVGLTTAVGTAAVLWIGVRDVQTGALTLGSLLLVMAYLGQLYAPLKTLCQKAGGLQGYLASAERVFSVLDRVPGVPRPPNARPGASKNELVAAAQSANAHDFIVNVPEGYQTQVGERGMRLSGGERQRISLARAFLKDAPILVLDEPTSSVDLKTEALIMQAMDRLMRDRTAVMIAHRTSTLENCDLKLELEGGHLVSPAKLTPASAAIDLREARR